MPSLPTDKPALRRQLRALRDGIPPKLREQKSREMAERLRALPLYGEAKAVLFYAPIGSEVDLLPLAEQALRDGKTVAFPVSRTGDHTLTFHVLTDLGQLVPGAYDIREPDTALPILTDFSEAICLVPALAFDRFGFRLGYGGGYYDRFLATFSGISLGVCFDGCLCDRLPRDSYDRRVDRILTEGGVRTPDETV